MSNTNTNPRNTFAAGDPARGANSPLPSTPNGFARISRRRLENQSSESNNSSSDPSSIDLSRLSLSTVSSPGTNITEPDEEIEIPKLMESLDTLLWLGLGQARAQQIWNRWEQVRTTLDIDFGAFAREFLKNVVEGDGCDIGDPNADWIPNLRRIGANEELAQGIANQGPKYDGVRFTKTAHQWVDLALDWRWEFLLYVKKASDRRAKGGLDLSAGSSSPIRVYMHLGEKDVGKEKYNKDKDVLTDASGNKKDYVVLWRGTSRQSAENMWERELRQGSFSIKNQRDPGPTDFSDIGAQYWTPEVETAQIYAKYTKKFVKPAMVCLIRFEVPRALIDRQDVKILRYPSEEFKRTIFYSRRGDSIQPKPLFRTVNNAELLIGDITTGINEKYVRMKGWEDVKEKHLMKLEDGTVATQYVFSHSKERDLEMEISKLSDKVSIHHHESPNVLLPPVEAVVFKTSP